MKRIKIVFVIALFVILLITNVSNASTGKVNTDTVRVREKASTSSEILTNAYKNDEVEIIEKEGDWYKVKVDGKSGYIKSDLLTVTNKDSSENTTSNETSNSSSNTQTNSTGFTINKKTSVRALPSIISVSLGSIDAGKDVTKIDEICNWYKVTDGKVTGWILNNRIGGQIQVTEEVKEDKKTETNTITNTTTNTVSNTTSEEKEKTVKNETTSSSVNKTGIINVKTARVRSEASSKGDNIIDLLDYNDEVTVLEKEGTWYKVKYGNNKEGYIDSSLVTMKDSQGVSSRSLGEERQTEKQVVESTANTENSPETASVTPPASGSGQAVVDFAMQFLGYPYVSAGKNPSTGFDCSGFTSYVFSNFGASLGGSATSQVSAGREVDRGSLVAGDLLLFYDDGKTKIGHAGIYISGGDFVHAANPKRGVVIDNINTSSYYNERYVTARRIVE